MNDPREPLTPEEAALARRLSRLAPHGEPSPALDARVLAAARAATEAAAPRRHPRWPAALGLAASVVLAVGIAWQLRPEPGPRVEAPAAQTSATQIVRDEPGPGEKMPPAAGAAADAPAAGAAAESAAAPPSPATPDPVARRAAPAVAKPAPAPSPPSPEPPVVFDEPSPMAFPLPPPPPAPAAPAPQAKRAAATSLPALPPPPAPRQQAAAGVAPEREQAFDAAVAADRAADEPDADVPPATADAPAVRAAWLQRIRELVADGELDAARASLREFVRRHPDEPLPDDLRPLLR